MDQEITRQVQAAIDDLFASADNLRPGDMLVVGCSTSEVGGKLIGTDSSEEIAGAIMDVILPEVEKRGLFLAAQCCEHLNRALAVERACMERYGLNEVWVTPWLHAGGAWSMEARRRFADPVMVEDLKGLAKAGVDIGGTFIGMHLRAVVVPVHSAHRRVGEATITMARTRPKYVGGPRAHYDMEPRGH